MITVPMVVDNVHVDVVYNIFISFIDGDGFTSDSLENDWQTRSVDEQRREANESVHKRTDAV